MWIKSDDNPTPAPAPDAGGSGVKNDDEESATRSVPDPREVGAVTDSRLDMERADTSVERADDVSVEADSKEKTSYGGGMIRAKLQITPRFRAKLGEGFPRICRSGQGRARGIASRAVPARSAGAP